MFYAVYRVPALNFEIYLDFCVYNRLTRDVCFLHSYQRLQLSGYFRPEYKTQTNTRNTFSATHEASLVGENSVDEQSRMG